MLNVCISNVCVRVIASAFTLVWCLCVERGALWRWQMFHASIIGLSFCSPVCQKWNISIKRCDQTVKGWCTLARSIRNEIPHLVLRLRAQRSSLPRFIVPYLPPLTPCLFVDCLISFLSPVFSQICLTSPFLLALSLFLASLSWLIHLSLSLTASFFLSPPCISACMWGDRPIGEPSVSLCPSVPRASSCDGA